MTVGRITPGIPAIVHLCGGIAQRRRFWLTAGSSGVRAVDQMDNGATYLQLLVTPGFDLAASVCFTDPFRVSNFLTGRDLVMVSASGTPDFHHTPEIGVQLKISQRQLGRLFKQYLGKSPVLYYRDLRLSDADAFQPRLSGAVRNAADAGPGRGQATLQDACLSVRRS